MTHTRFTPLLIVPIAWLLATNQVDAEIIFNDVHPDVVLNENSFDLDLNNDGQTDFTLEHSVALSGPEKTEIPFLRIYRSVSSGLGLLLEDNQHDEFVKVVNANHQIANADPDDGVFVNESPSPWLGQMHKYFGVQFSISGNTHYGWVEFSVDNSAIGTIHSWAYESEVDTAIAAGVAAIPEARLVPVWLTFCLVIIMRRFSAKPPNACMV